MDVATRRILVADDEAPIRSLLESFLQDEGYEVDSAASGEEVLEKAKANPPDLLLIDVYMPPGIDGIEVIKRLQAERLQIPVIVFTAAGTSQMAIEAMQLGAYDYVPKPFDLDELALTIKRLFEYQELMKQVHELKEQLRFDPADRMIGRHPKVLEVFKTIGRIARSDATVLILGETGSGKTMLAEQIHRASNRRGGPFVTVAIATLPETLLESELFGHEKGAFTSAIAQRKGRFEMAHRGTIFLDEIGEMTLATQRKLLRVLQDKEFERVGGSIPIRVDVRVIAATNKPLPDEVAKGNFREDLYYRLNVVTIDMPPLRERRHEDENLNDVRNLTFHFLNKHRYNNSPTPSRISEEALQRVLDHDYPGNVRELENVVERAVVMAQGGLITPEHVVFTHSPVPGTTAGPVDVEQAIRRGQSLHNLISTIERRALQFALRETGGSHLAAARLLGMARDLFEDKLREHELGEGAANAAG
ncbi:MAG: sigma-54-dependent Fis family transcriptional regulator [Chloroflexi bacterium]|nr:sigma-54-dependent Fis family transcriptional regulator [Chloroflexota bacterium]